MAVQAVCARRLCSRRMQKFVEERFRLILRDGFSSSLERGDPRLTRTALNEEEESPVSNCVRESSNVAQESCHDSPKQAVVCGKEQPIGSVKGNGDIEGGLQSHVGTRHSQGPPILQKETAWLPQDNNSEKNTSLTARARELKSQVGRPGGGITTSEAIANLKKRQQQGMIIDSYEFVEVLQRCSKQKDIGAARQVHACIIQSGMDSNPHVANTLLHVYMTCGRLNDARRVFDGLETKTDVSWRVMIMGYAKNFRPEDAVELFNRMRREGGAQPNESSCGSILKACASPLDLKWGKEVHAYIRQAGLDSDVRLGTAVVQMYAKCGCITEARRVFDQMTGRNVFTWNVMIGAYADSAWGAEAYRLFVQMEREGLKPDAFTYASVLKGCASAGALEWVKEVHSHVLKAGLEPDLRLSNALVHTYAKSGSIDDARLVFDRMEKRNVVTWNSMIGAYAERGCAAEAHRLFLQMILEGFIPDAFTCTLILNPSASGSAGALEWVKDVHRHALKAGLESDIRVGNALVHMYAKCGSIDDARLTFDRLKTRRDVRTWSIMIGAYASSGCRAEACRLFLQMEREGVKPDAITYVCILNSEGSGALEWVREVHSHALRAGLDSDLRVRTALVHMYAKSGGIDDARLVFDRMGKRDVVAWNSMIGAYAESGYFGVAYRLFLQMKDDGFKPNAATYVNILNASASTSAGALEFVKSVHSHALKAGLESDSRVGNALIHLYSKCGSIDNARLVFDRMETRDVVTWTTMIGGLAQHGCGLEALELFRTMTADGVKADGASFVAVLSACCHAGLLDDGHRLFSSMRQDYAVEPTVLHYTCMVDLLGRAGQLEEARLFIADMPVKPDGVTWQTLLCACRTYGNVELGEFAADELLELEPKNASAYVLLSNIYAAAGMWEKVSLVRTVMHERGVRKESGRSWIEVDGKVHEFIAGDTSHPEAKAIYAELNRLTEELKGAGYNPDTQLVLQQNIAEDDKELVLCSHSEKLAIAYGLLRTPIRGTPIRVYKNLRVCSDCHSATKFMSKVTGREIIARDATRFHHFKDGACSCGDYW